MFRKPLRTYQRNPKPTSLTTNNPFHDVELTFHQKLDESNTSSESIFDRILKTAKLPPLPVQPLDNTEYSSSSYDSSDNEPLELIPIKNPKFSNNSNSVRKKKTVSQRNNNKKKLPKNAQVPKKKESTKRDHTNDDGVNEGIEFPPLRKTRREGNKLTTPEVLIDKLPDKLDNFGTSAVTKDLKDCCVILTRMNLHDKNINNNPLSHAFSTHNVDSDKKVQSGHSDKEIVSSTDCRVLLSRFDSESEQKQNDLQYKDSLQPMKAPTTNLLNVNMSVFSSTPFERRIISRRSIPTLSPIKNNVNISVENDHPATILFDKTSEIIFSDENSPRKDISHKRKGPRLSKIKKIPMQSKENNEYLNSMKTINIDDSTKNSSSHSLPLYEKTSKIIFSDSEDVIQDTYASIHATNKNGNSYGSNVSNNLPISNEKDVETSKPNQTSIINTDGLEESSEINSELESKQYLEEVSANLEVDTNTEESENNFGKTSMEFEIGTETNQDSTEIQSSTIHTRNKSSNSSISMNVSENDDDSLHLVMSSTPSDKESTGNDSKQIESNQDSSNSIINLSNSKIDNNSDTKEDCKKPGELVVLLTRLDDPVKISETGVTHRNWRQPLDVITENSDQSHNSNVSLNISARLEDNKPLFLKPGKSWARSLSILNNIHNADDVEFLSSGKGKKWRQSVRNVLNMQFQGLRSSCITNPENNDKTLHEISHLYGPKSPLSISNGAIDSTNFNRYTRRMSIRVVPNIKKKGTKENIIHDTSFLEVYGITDILTDDKTKRTKKSILKVPRKTLGYNLRCTNVPERISPEPVTSAKTVVLERCNQKDSIPFDQCYPESYLKHCRKIGEGVYGEVFLYDHQKQKSVIKIIPIEGTELVNGETQKKFHEILSEIIIAKELHKLRFDDTYQTNGFVEVKSIRCIVGKYPQKLLDLWKIYDDEKNSENDCPSMFGENQLYIALELGDGGQDMEAFLFNNANEAYITFLQTALTLAVGEKSLEFEHRDMHWGNILISRTKEKEVSYKLDNKEITLACNGIKVAIIDFTLSRMSYEGCCIFNDLALDPALFNAAGEYQFEIYRLMRTKIGNDWQLFEPYTNILWLHYTLDKMIKEVRYKKTSTKIHKAAIQKLQDLKDIILDYNSAFDLISNCDKLSDLQHRCSNN